MIFYFLDYIEIFILYQMKQSYMICKSVINNRNIRLNRYYKLILNVKTLTLH